ncbi:MAG: hypothetical protein ABH986_04850 [archaeon]
MDKKEFVVFSVLFIILFYFSSYLSDPYLFALCSPCGCFNSMGFPLTFSEELPLIAEEYSCETTNKVDFNYLTIDLIFWYAVSFAAILTVKKIRNKNLTKK